MAAGDAVVGLSSIANNAFLAVQPGGGVEWSIHNVFGAGAVELHWYDGSNDIQFDSAGASTTTPAAWTGYVFECTNATYLRIKNVSGSTILLGYSGRVTK